MFERYTEKARRTIFFARYEASQFGASAMEPEHLLLGLLREDKGLLPRILVGRRTTVADVRNRIESRVSRDGAISVSVELPLSQELKRVLAYAHEESDRAQHRHIGTEHLLLGLLRHEGTIAFDALTSIGVDAESVRKRIAAGEIDATAERATAFINSTRNMMRNKPLSPVVLGLEKLLTTHVSTLRGARVGLVCNQASVDHGFRHAADLLHAHPQINVTTLFGAQHGIRGDVQDNMIETPHTHDEATGLPIYSLYSETREPTDEMLRDLDAIVFDMQDVGCRIYTFIYTLANCMRAAARLNKRVVVCDRPNPIGGARVAGNVLEAGWESFVGQYSLPTRHGMTVCELARLFNEDFGINCQLEILSMDGWARDLYMDETDAPWVMPSPNMPTIDAAVVFPGTVHHEGTQMSEGRGTTRPFELIGAPYIDARAYVAELERLNLPGVRFRAANFLPTFQKHAGVVCGGAQLHVTDREAFEPVSAGLATIKVAYEMYKADFKWKEPPYEYVFDRNPFDVIAGTDAVRQAIERGNSLTAMEASWQPALQKFVEQRSKHLIY